MLKLAFLGDFFPGGLLSLNRDVLALDPKLQTKLHGMDLVVANLETPFGNPEDLVENKAAICSYPEDIARLDEANVSVVSLANNHIFDLGNEGFYQTLNVLKEKGISCFGAGRNIDEARSPVIVSHNGIKIGFLGYCREFKGLPLASTDQPGVAPLVAQHIEEDVKKTKADCDHLFVYLHWGKEFSWFPLQEDKRLAEDMLKWGVSGIMGSHAHRIQELHLTDSSAVCYSLGNFVFTDWIIGPPLKMAYTSKESVDNLKKTKVVRKLMNTSSPTYYKWPWTSSRLGLIMLIEISESSFRSNPLFITSCSGGYPVSIMKGFGEDLSSVFVSIISHRLVRSIYYLAMKAAYRTRQLVRVLKTNVNH